MAGTILEDKLNAFERLLFRATRGNMFLKNASVGSVVDPTTTEKVEKAVFVVFFAGERARSKILKARTPDSPTLERLHGCRLVLPGAPLCAPALLPFTCPSLAWSLHACKPQQNGRLWTRKPSRLLPECAAVAQAKGYVQRQLLLSLY